LPGEAFGRQSGMLVSAVVVNLDQQDMVLDCVSSLEVALARVDGPTEVTVVDNGSTDASVDALRTHHPSVKVIENGANLGFPTAVAIGIRATRGEWVLMLNNDATIEPDGVVELLRAAGGGPEVGSVAAQLRFADGSERINSAGIGVDRLGVAYDRLVGELPNQAEDEPTEVFGASGGASIFRRTMLDDVGGVDESFFVYLEDVDLAWRAQSKGWKSLYAPRAVAYHHHSFTTKHGSSFKYYHVGLNRIRILAKNAPTRHLIKYGLPILAYDTAYVLFALLTDRTIAPLTGRLRGLREWCRYRLDPPTITPAALEPIRGLRAALGRRRVWLGREGAKDGD
jgi:GT2 family glycosyltransferase